MTNINKVVWDYIDRRGEVKKLFLEGLLNISALARKIATENNLENNVDAVISAIRRYEIKKEKKEKHEKVYDLLKKAKISTKTKLASILVRRTDESERKVSLIYSKISFKRESTLRLFEISNYIKIIADQEFLNEIMVIFDKEIESVEKNLGELTVNYGNDITKTPGVFVTLANEMAMNEISIIDSMICHWEHIIIVKEANLEKAFGIVMNLTKTI